MILLSMNYDADAEQPILGASFPASSIIYGFRGSHCFHLLDDAVEYLYDTF
jgi:hypothetical protein